jgi:hypothetical protein
MQRVTDFIPSPPSLLPMYASNARRVLILLLPLSIPVTTASSSPRQSAEHLVGHLLLWWNGASIKAMMFKNLAAHRLRNRKTTMMYSLSLAFIIFIVVTFGLQILTFDYQYKQASGSLLRLRCPKYADGPALLASLRTLTTDDPYVQDVSIVIAGPCFPLFVPAIGIVDDNWLLGRSHG